jgi:hypothetical protein
MRNSPTLDPFSEAISNGGSRNDFLFYYVTWWRKQKEFPKRRGLKETGTIDIVQSINNRDNLLTLSA